nr:oxysterol binding protein 1 [Hymenolepis microstoma]
MTDETSGNLKGHLLKWTNYLKGYQKRWFVLQNGLLSYYRGTINLANAKIAATGHLTLVISNSSTQTFHLKAANEVEHKKWMAALTLARSNALALGKSGDDSDGWEEADDDESDLAWSGPTLMPEDAARLVDGSISNFENRISDLQHYQDILKQKADDLQKVINDLEGSNVPPDFLEKTTIIRDRAALYKVASLAMVNYCSDFLGYARSQTRRWRKIFNAQADRCARLEQMVEQLAKQINKLESQARSKSMNPGSWGIPGQAVPVHRTSIEASCMRAATLSSNLSSSMRPTTNEGTSGPPGVSSTIVSEDEEDNFYDAAEDAGADEFDVILPSTNPCPYPGPLSQGDSEREGMVDARQSLSSDVPIGADAGIEYESDIGDSDTDDQGKGQRENRAHVIQKHAWGKAGRQPKETTSSSYMGPGSPAPEKRLIPIRKPVVRRTSIPPKPNISLNLWSFLSNCIGKELTKIPMPVNFSEPLSMLQRLSENFEYSYVLDRAAACTNPVEQLAYVSAFVVSSYASTALRVAKPFNPLLNETYECDRTDDLGWRSVAEQVSHHPPVAAFHCESDLWYTWFDFSISTKFRGRYLQIKVNGVCHLVFRKTGYHYTWTKIPLTVHNIIVGRLWIENSGEIDIINHTTGDKCHLTFKQYSYFSSEVPRRVTGAVTDKTGKVHGIIGGTWDEFIEYAPVITDSTGSSNKHVIETGPPIQLWRVSPLPPEAEKMYNFTQFAMQLNDKPENEPNLCPTDSRLRPDQRLMEDGSWDEANAEKVRLEEKQRMRRRQMALKLLGTDEAESATAVGSSAVSSAPLPAALMDTLDQTHKPLWFEKVVDEDTGLETMKFNGKYWKSKEKNDWSMCPDLY